MNINLLELFGGICGFTKGLEDAGFKIDKQYLSEVDKYATAVSRYNYPGAVQLGDIKTVIQKLEDLGVKKCHFEWHKKNTPIKRVK